MPHHNQTKKGFANMFVLVIFLLTMGGTVWYFKKFPLTQAPTGQSQIDTKLELATKPTEPIHVAATTTQSASINTSSWMTYKSSKLGFSVKYPASWYIFEESPTGFLILATVPWEKRMHGSGIPESGPRIEIESTNCKGSMDDTQGNYVSGDKYGGYAIVKRMCKNSFTLSLVPGGKNNQADENILNAIAASFGISKN